MVKILLKQKKKFLILNNHTSEIKKQRKIYLIKRKFTLKKLTLYRMKYKILMRTKRFLK